MYVISILNDQLSRVAHLFWGALAIGRGEPDAQLQGKFKEQLILWKDITDMASKLLKIQTLTWSASQMGTQDSGFSQLFFRNGCGGIVSKQDPVWCLPFGIVFTSNQHFGDNLIAVTVLEDRGRKMSGWESAYLDTDHIATRDHSQVMSMRNVVDDQSSVSQSAMDIDTGGTTTGNNYRYYHRGSSCCCLFVVLLTVVMIEVVVFVK
jgi:hypothetical protein